MDTFAGDMVGFVPADSRKKKVEKKKPAPDIYLMARDFYGLESSNCVVVEDRCACAFLCVCVCVCVGVYV